jgi:hypothetical protein
MRPALRSGVTLNCTVIAEAESQNSLRILCYNPFCISAGFLHLRIALLSYYVCIIALFFYLVNHFV